MSSDSDPTVDPEQEQYAYAVTRKLFNYTLIGAVLFSAVIVVLWYAL